MAVGETAGQAPSGRRVISAGGGRRRPAEEAVPVDAAPDEEVPAEEAKPLVKEADPALEALLAEEEEIERRTRREHHEAPKFHGDEE
jgi:small subunit ribosomal protein S3